MAKGVFISRVDPDYDDLPEIRYHFPKKYLRKAEQCVGDWILYYEPRRNRGRQSYYATARVARIEADDVRPGHYYAHVEDYLEFPHPVPYREGDMYYESALRLENGGPNLGLFQWSVHHLQDHEYSMILTVGMENYDLLKEIDATEGNQVDRPVIEQIIRRPYRDKAFAVVVRDAYGSTCAFTSLHLENGEGRREIEAAHIRAVEDRGPDSPRNGVALSRTVHWMFDRGILSLEDDGRILMADRLVPEPMKGLLNSDGYAHLPEKGIFRPHPQFLRFHREHRFKG